MELSPAYYQWENETLQKGQLKGQQKGRAEMQRVFVENLLKTRFGKLDKALSRLIDPLLKVSPEETVQLLLNLSRQELLAKFRS